MGLSGDSADFRHRQSRLVARFRKGTSRIERPGWIPKTRTRMIETLDRAGAADSTDEALMNDISRRRDDALTELYRSPRPCATLLVNNLQDGEARLDSNDKNTHDRNSRD